MQQGSKNSGAGQNSSEGRAVPAHVDCVHIVIADVDSARAGAQEIGQKAAQLLGATDLLMLCRLQRAQGSLELIKVKIWSQTTFTVIYSGLC